MRERRSRSAATTDSFLDDEARLRRGSATIPPKGAVRACGVRRIKKREYVFIFVNFRFADIHEYEYYTLLVFMTMNTAKSQYSYSYS